MTAQVIELLSTPTPEKMQPVRNPPQYRSGNLIEWLKCEYRGNKPFGGLWTSSHTPDDSFLCDWQRGRKTNQLIQLAFPQHNAEFAAYLLYPCGSARICEISDLTTADSFTSEYRLITIALPHSLRRGIGITITAEITDWERVAHDYDAIHLTEEAADEIAYAMLHGAETAFHTWNCESTLWTRWKFERAEQL